MAENAGKEFGVLPLFDPTESRLIRAPLEEGKGWWAGAPSAMFDQVTNHFYIVYRLRQPRDQGRGIECRIAVSDNGVSFTDIWALPKSTLGALSVERCSLIRGFDGKWKLYISYACPDDGRWRISLLEANEPDEFDVSKMIPLFTADSLGVEGVKDPNVFLIGRMFYMLVSYATREPAIDPAQEGNKHATGDIYATGLTRSRTGAAVSGDGRRFQWLGDVSPRAEFTPSLNSDGEIEGHADVSWDDYCRRTGALVPLESGGYLAFYDGSASVEENYEEKTGLAMTFDLKNYYSLSPDAPGIISPYGTGSLRYIDVLPVGHELFYYFEMAQPGGGHDLRVSVVERDNIAMLNSAF